MMITSAPFDNWWHNAYGLDVKIISPPHMILAWGMIGIQIGAMLLALSAQNRASDEDQGMYSMVHAYTAGILITMIATVVQEDASVGNHMLKRMADWPSKHRLVGDVRGRGLMIGVEIVRDQKTKEYGADLRDRIVELAFERGILFLGCGPSTVRISPPLIVSKDEADVAIDVLEESIEIASKGA